MPIIFQWSNVGLGAEVCVCGGTGGGAGGGRWGDGWSDDEHRIYTRKIG